MRTRKEQPPYKLGLRFLEESPDGLTASELSDLLGIAKRNVLEYIKIWKEEDGILRIKSWRKPPRSGDLVPVYAMKDSPDQKDKRKPAPMTCAEKQRRYREKMGPIIRARRRLSRTGDPKTLRMLFEGVIKK